MPTHPDDAKFPRHAATVAQPARAPHPATVAQRRTTAAGGPGTPPHAATVAQPARAPHPATVAQRRTSTESRAAGSPARDPGKTAQRYTASPYLMDGFTDRTSDNGGIVLHDKKTLYARQDLIDAANLALASVNGDRGSYVELLTTGEVYGDDADLLRVTVRMRAGRHLLSRASPYHVELAQLNAQPNQPYQSHADCHLTAQTIMGSDDAPAGLDNTEQPVIRGPNDDYTLLEPVRNAKVFHNLNSDAGANRAMYAFFLHAMPLFAPILGRLAEEARHEARRARYLALKDRIERLQGVKLDKEVMSAYAAVYRAIYDQPVLSSVFAQTFGVNQYAIPAIGEALTQVNDEGEKIAADKGGVTDLWNFHWAGVILRDGADYVTLENLSTEFLSDKNAKWYFAMYGAGGQSFHTEASRDSHVGAHPLTLRIRTVPVARAVGKRKPGGSSKLQAILEQAKKL
ncbi:hypothetical protein [Polyangium spumosum]|uniref:Uncharacterized protein n=1 Tax=Polyangium spumosum TaxID=889282 RepID=A0A6N7Q3H5_9BACT|nr:hypothetical protein [Polyangium spumosum]MRG95451.1 hypothetical protein [Polyangium spumosum]